VQRATHANDSANDAHEYMCRMCYHDSISAEWITEYDVEQFSIHGTTFHICPGSNLLQEACGNSYA